MSGISFKVPIRVDVSRAWEAPSGDKMVTLEGLAYGVGIFRISVREDIVPDAIEGTDATGIFSFGIGKGFKPYVRLVGFDL